MQRPRQLVDASPETELLAPVSSSDVLRAVCVLISQSEGTEASRALAGLLRALYLDTSSFNFATLDCLGPINRRYAERLISARLWDTCDIEEWEQAYDLVCNYEFAQGDPMLARRQEIFPSEEGELETLQSTSADEGPSLSGKAISAASAALMVANQAVAGAGKGPAGSIRSEAMLLSDKLMYSFVLALVAILIFVLV